MLVLHLNRSLYTTYATHKNTCRVRFPEILDLTPYTTSGQLSTVPSVPISSPASHASSSVHTPASGDIDDDLDSLDNENGRANGRSTTPTLRSPNNLLPSQTEPAEAIERILYRLSAVVCHYGSHSFGHYIAYRRKPPLSTPSLSSLSSSSGYGGWLRISDDSVKECGIEEVLREGSGAFMLFYERVTPTAGGTPVTMTGSASSMQSALSGYARPSGPAAAQAVPFWVATATTQKAGAIGIPNGGLNPRSMPIPIPKSTSSSASSSNFAGSSSSSPSSSLSSSSSTTGSGVNAGLGDIYMSSTPHSSEETLRPSSVRHLRLTPTGGTAVGNGSSVSLVSSEGESDVGGVKKEGLGVGAGGLGVGIVGPRVIRSVSLLKHRGRSGSTSSGVSLGAEDGQVNGISQLRTNGSLASAISKSSAGISSSISTSPHGAIHPLSPSPSPSASPSPPSAPSFSVKSHHPHTHAPSSPQPQSQTQQAPSQQSVTLSQSTTRIVGLKA